MSQLEKKYYDPMDEWNSTMENILGKEKWDSLNYWQKMCEVAALQEYRKNNNGLLSFLGIYSYDRT